MATVAGRNIILYIKDAGIRRLYACAKSCSLQVNTSMVETSVTGSGKWASFLPQKHSWTGTFEGVVNLEASVNFNLYDLRTKQADMTLLDIVFERTDNDGNKYTDECTGYIINSSDTGSIEDVATFSIEIQGTGSITMTYA